VLVYLHRQGSAFSCGRTGGARGWFARPGIGRTTVLQHERGLASNLTDLGLHTIRLPTNHPGRSWRSKVRIEIVERFRLPSGRKGRRNDSGTIFGVRKDREGSFTQ
jgi:hypothetical protein